MKGIYKILIFLYIIFPFIVAPVLAYHNRDGYFLFCILFYYIGAILATFEEKIFFLLPLVFCGWYWHIFGFRLNGFLAVGLAFMTTGAVFYMFTDIVKNWVDVLLPEEDELSLYEAKYNAMNAQIATYQKNNPTKFITQDILDRIILEVFFKVSI